MKRLFVFASILISSQVSLAHPCALPRQGPVANILFRAGVNCALAEELANTLADLAQSYPLAAPKVTLSIGDKATNASFDNGHIIWIPQTLYFADASGRTQNARPEQFSAVVVHEYGHAVLNVALKKAFDEDLGSLFDSFQELSTEAEENILLKISPRGFRNKGSKVANTDEFQVYNRNIPAYSELFADALAVFYFNDPSVMKNALAFAKISPDKSLQVKLRDFAVSHSLDSLKETNDVHTKLSLVRSHLGTQMLGKTLYERRQLLEKLQAAILKSLALDLRRAETLSIEQLNQQMIELLKK